jgi:hypothetical protein
MEISAEINNYDRISANTRLSAMDTGHLRIPMLADVRQASWALWKLLVPT